jgi:hypothetical protein
VEKVCSEVLSLANAPAQMFGAGLIGAKRPVIPGFSGGAVDYLTGKYGCRATPRGG